MFQPGYASSIFSKVLESKKLFIKCYWVKELFIVFLNDKLFN
jgi:hypothetical protein